MVVIPVVEVLYSVDLVPVVVVQVRPEQALAGVAFGVTVAMD
jgi:hypothetical protein